MPRRISISEARGRLPELARYVTETDDKVVLIDHRDLPGALVLTTEAHLRSLTTMIDELKRRDREPFRLEGSITSDLSDEELEGALEEIRAEQRRLSESKLRSFSE
jgi:PHD/YefM family antitoxin component YafN of YafNO toxin-antitoxin module